MRTRRANARSQKRKDPARVEHAKRAEAKARDLIDKIRPLDRRDAERHVHENPPDVETIVAMAFFGQRKAANAPRPDALSTEIEDIHRTKPLASADEVIGALRERAKVGEGADVPPVIHDVRDDGTVVWDDNGKIRDAKKTAIAKRLSRIGHTQK